MTVENKIFWLLCLTWNANLLDGYIITKEILHKFYMSKVIILIKIFFSFENLIQHKNQESLKIDKYKKNKRWNLLKQEWNLTDLYDCCGVGMRHNINTLPPNLHFIWCTFLKLPQQQNRNTSAEKFFARPCLANEIQWIPQ